MHQPATAISIRPANDGDIRQIKDLLRLAWHQAYAPTLGENRVNELIRVWHSKERLKNDIAQTNINFLVAEGAGNIPAENSAAANPGQEKTFWLCATATATMTPPDNTLPLNADIIIGRMYVHPLAQKNRLGSMMMQHIMKPLAPGTRLALTVEPANQGAIRFYQRFGFEIHGPGSCSEDPHDDVPTLIMTKTINRRH